MQKKTIDTPQVFSVGLEDSNDYTPDEIELLIYKIRDWFISPECDRNYSDPLKEATDKVQQCLEGTTKAGKIWKTIPLTFSNRIRAKTLYDMEDGKHVAQQRDKTVVAKRNTKHRKDKEIAKYKPPTQGITATLELYQLKSEQEILDAYPELNTPVHQPNVRRLAMFYTEQERIRLELPGASSHTRKNHIETLSLLQRSISDTMKSLDIYPDQVNKRMDAKRKGSVGDLVALLDEDEEFKDRERRWSLTLALQLWWMTKHSNGRQNGPQIHDFEMWHLTRTRPIRYNCECGRDVMLVEGFTPEDLRDYLVLHGVLVEKPVLPQLLTEEHLHGLEAYGNDQSTPEDTDNEGSLDTGGKIDSQESQSSL